MALQTPLPGKPVTYDTRNLKRPKKDGVQTIYGKPPSIFPAPAPRPIQPQTTPLPIGWNLPTAQKPQPAAPVSPTPSAATPAMPPAVRTPAAMQQTGLNPAPMPAMDAPAQLAASLPFVQEQAAKKTAFETALNSPTAQANRMKFTGRPEPIAQQQALAAAAAQKPASPATQSAGPAGDFGQPGATGSPAGTPAATPAPAAKPTTQAQKFQRGLELQRQRNMQNLPVQRPASDFAEEIPFGRGMNGEPALSERPFGMSMNGEVNQTALLNSLTRKRSPATPAATPAATAPLLPRPKLGASEDMINSRLSRASGRMTGRRRNKFSDGPYRGRTVEDAARMMDQEANAMSQYQQ